MQVYFSTLLTVVKLYRLSIAFSCCYHSFHHLSLSFLFPGLAWHVNIHGEKKGTIEGRGRPFFPFPTLDFFFSRFSTHSMSSTCHGTFQRRRKFSISLSLSLLEYRRELSPRKHVSWRRKEIYFRSFSQPVTDSFMLHFPLLIFLSSLSFSCFLPLLSSSDPLIQRRKKKKMSTGFLMQDKKKGKNLLKRNQESSIHEYYSFPFTSKINVPFSLSSI